MADFMSRLERGQMIYPDDNAELMSFAVDLIYQVRLIVELTCSLFDSGSGSGCQVRCACQFVWAVLSRNNHQRRHLPTR